MPTAVQIDRVIVPCSQGGGPDPGGCSGAEAVSGTSTVSATSPSSARRGGAIAFAGIQPQRLRRRNRGCVCRRAGSKVPRDDVPWLEGRGSRVLRRPRGGEHESLLAAEQ